MAAPEDVLPRSPADFDSSLAYALHGEMRRLLIVTIVGSILLPVGLVWFLSPDTAFVGWRLVQRLIGLGLALAGATFFYGGIVAILFKVFTDAGIVAEGSEP